MSNFWDSRPDQLKTNFLRKIAIQTLVDQLSLLLISQGTEINLG